MRPGGRDPTRALSGEVPLVGRERARGLLHRWLEASLAGDPHIVVISGPSGIGKTRLTDWLAAQAADRGARVHSGGCHAGPSLAYWPFLTAFADLRTASGARVTEIFERGRDAELGDPLLAAGAPLGQGVIAIADAVVDAARAAPMLIVVDDVQWADPSSLGLISHLATVIGHRAATAPVPVMFVVGTRPGETSEAHQRLVVTLQREPNARLIELRGLDHLELLTLLTELGGAPPTPELAHRVGEATDGNPLLTLWLMRRLLAEGTIGVAGGVLRATIAGPLELELTNIDDELERRLDAISAPARQLITTAAGLGDGGTLHELAAASDVVEPELGDQLMELEAAGLLHDDGTRYHFVQGQLRQVVLGHLSTRRRRVLHQTIAQRLTELYAESGDDHSLTLAEHLCRGRAPAARLVEVCGSAADHAFAIESWGKAAQLYEAALEAAAELGWPSGDLAAWSLGAGVAHFQSLDLPRAEIRLRGAIASAAPDDLATRGRAALVLTRCRLTQGGSRPGQLVDLTELESFLAAADTMDVEPELRALALGLMAESHFSAFDLETGFELSGRARRASAAMGDDAVSCMVEVAEGMQHLGALQLDAATACFVRSLDHGRRRDPGLPLGALARHALVCWLRGDLDDAEDLIRQSIEETEPRYQWGEQSFATACAAGLAALRGRHHLAEQLGDQARRLYRATSYPYAALQLYPALAWSRAVRGDGAGAYEAIDEWRGGPRRGGASYRPVLEALSGGAALGDVVVPAGWREPPPGQLTLLDVSTVAARIELGDALDDVTLVGPALEPIESLIEAGIAFALDRGSFLPRLAGVAALRMGMFDRADAHLLRAEGALTTRVDSPGELARCRLDRARMLIARDGRGDRSEAARLLDSASEGFDAIGMMPFLERVAVARDALPSDVSSVPLNASTSTRIILVTDLVGSTALNVGLGDLDYVGVLADHDRLVRARLRQNGGVEFKHTGDGFCAWFTGADDAVAAASGVQRDLDEWRDLHPDVDLRVRCGLAAGRPVEVGGDLFGSSVALASRVCAVAGDDEVVATAEVIALLTERLDHSARCQVRGEYSLKGFPAAITVYTVADPS